MELHASRFYCKMFFFLKDALHKGPPALRIGTEDLLAVGAMAPMLGKLSSDPVAANRALLRMCGAMLADFSLPQS